MHQLFMSVFRIESCIRLLTFYVWVTIYDSCMCEICELSRDKKVRAVFWVRRRECNALNTFHVEEKWTKFELGSCEKLTKNCNKLPAGHMTPEHELCLRVSGCLQAASEKG